MRTVSPRLEFAHTKLSKINLFSILIIITFKGSVDSKKCDKHGKRCHLQIRAASYKEVNELTLYINTMTINIVVKEKEIIYVRLSELKEIIKEK